MRVLITGASGFVGTALRTRLLAQQHTLICTTRSASAIPAVPLPGEEWRVTGFSDVQWLSWFDELDAVVHLAGKAHDLRPLSAQVDDYHAINTGITARLAEQAAARNVHFVYLSSVKVHGERSPADPAAAFSENSPPAPVGSYAVSKWEAEQVLAGLAHASQLKHTVLRPPLVYGPGVGANFLRLITAVDRGWPLPFSAVTNLRSLIFLGNLCDAIAECLTQPNAIGKTFLLRDAEDVSTAELIRKIGVALGKPARLWPLPISALRLAGRLTNRTASVDRLVGSFRVDSELAREQLQWAPPYTLDQGLALTMDWYKARGPSL